MSYPQSRQISVISRRERIYTPASYVHELGLKFGIHIMRGIHVRQQKSIFLLKEHFLPQTWWRIRPRSADGIRICNDSFSGWHESEMLYKAIQKSNREIVLSLSPGPAHVETVCLMSKVNPNK